MASTALESIVDVVRSLGSGRVQIDSGSFSLHYRATTTVFIGKKMFHSRVTTSVFIGKKLPLSSHHYSVSVRKLVRWYGLNLSVPDGVAFLT